MRGRKIGSSEVTVNEMSRIVELTGEGASRGDIAKDIGRSKMTVYLYQKRLLE